MIFYDSIEFAAASSCGCDDQCYDTVSGGCTNCDNT